MDAVEITSDAIDRISELPDFVSHRILSFLDRRSAATTSVLSKHWSSVWNSFPILQFELFIHDFHGEAEAEAEANAFVGSVDKAFWRLTGRNLRVQRFDLSIFYFYVNEALVSRINQWLALALCGGAREIFVSAYMKFYLHLAETVFVAKPVKGGFCPRFGSLVKLVLHYVHISESVVRNIVLQCPNVEFLELLYFEGLKDLEISELGKLEIIKLISIEDELQRIDIDAPSLKEFDYVTYDGFKLHTMSLTSCRHLRSLSLFGCAISDDWLRWHLSSFPLLEALVINGSPALRSVRVSAPRLRTLLFFDCENIEVIEIDAPTLSSFEYWGDLANPVLLSENVSCPMKIFHTFYDTELETPWFVNLRNNLGVSTDQRKTVCLNLMDFGAPGVRVDFDKQILNYLLDEAPPKVNVDCLVIGYYITSESILDFMKLIDGLLWSCRPNTIFMHCLGSHVQHECIKVLCKKLLLRGNLMYCCDANCHVKCWRHDIKAVKLQSFRGLNEDNEVVHVFKGIEDTDDSLTCLNTLVNLDSIHHDHEIRFELEWK